MKFLWRLLAVSLLLLPFGVATARAEEPDALPGGIMTLRRSDVDENTTVPALPTRPGPRIRVTNITVTYHGFSPEAQAAFQSAVDIWESQITSPVELKVDAHWEPLEEGVLGMAGPATFLRNFSGAPRRDVYYPIGIANKVAGRDLDPAEPDIVAYFNSAEPDWYYGTDGRTPSRKMDFKSVVLHEIGHGLGFTGAARLSSAGVATFGTGSGYSFIYDQFTVDGSRRRLLDLGSGSIDLARGLIGGNLFFAGERATRAAGGAPRLYAPAMFEEGSSYSHLDEATYPAGNPNSLMTPRLGYAEAIHDPGPIGRALLQDLGWDDATTPTATPTPTATRTPVVTATPTRTPIATSTPTRTPGPTLTPTRTPSAAPAGTQTASATPRVNQTASPTPRPSQTGIPTSTPTQPPNSTASPTVTPTSQATQVASQTPRATQTANAASPSPGNRVYLPALARGQSAD